MNSKVISNKTKLAIAISKATIAAVCLGVSLFAAAEVTFDDGTGDTLTGSMVIDAGRGLTQGANLLHTFSTFNVLAGETANFTGPDVIDNIIARVTGAGVTTIDGTLQSLITSADLFILNPNGVMIGAGADINIDGGLYLTSANSLTFADGSQLLVSDTGASGFTAAASSEFGFGMTPADISFDGVSITTPQTSPGVYGDAPFDSLVVAGGDLAFNNSSVLLAGKDIELVSLNGAASVLVGGNNATLVGETDLGNIVISNDIEPTMVGSLQTSGDPAGKITVVGNRLSMSKAFVFSDSLGDNVGDGIQIALSDSLVLTDGSRITTDTLAGGDGADITISASTISLDGERTTIASNVLSADGNGGALTLSASDINLSNFSRISSNTSGDGDGGSVTVNTNTLNLDSGAKIVTVTLGSGNSGSILVDATGNITLAGQETVLQTSSVSFFSGDAGSLTLNAQDLQLTEEARIESESSAFFGGGAGDVTINVNSLSVEGFSAILSTNASDFVPSGSISISANSVLVAGSNSTNDLSRIASITEGAAGGGSIVIAADNIAANDGGAIEVFTIGPGAGGSINLVGNLTVNGGRIDAQTVDIGEGGQIAITGDVTVSNGGEILSSTSATQTDTGNAGSISLAGSSLIVEAAGSRIASATAGGGDAGSINISSTAISVTNGGTIDTSTTSLETGAGAAGQISLSASDINVAGTGTAISSTTAGNASGGDISLTATNNIAINDHGIVTATATADGDAGSISLNAEHNFDLLDGGSVITSAALSGGGNVDVMVTDRIYLRNGTITASSGGPAAGADGGIIQIDPIFLILDRSSIVAEAVQGNGGFITLESQNFVRDFNSVISATSDFGNDGEVLISSPDNSVTGIVGVLPSSFANDDALLTEPCAARALERRSSLVIDKMSADTTAPDDYTLSRTLSCSPN